MRFHKEVSLPHYIASSLTQSQSGNRLATSRGWWHYLICTAEWPYTPCAHYPYPLKRLPTPRKWECRFLGPNVSPVQHSAAHCAATNSWSSFITPLWMRKCLCEFNKRHRQHLMTSEAVLFQPLSLTKEPCLKRSCCEKSFKGIFLNPASESPQ